MLLVLSCCGALSAGIRPSLDLSVCSWNATDILVMVATQKGNFQVVEVIKGDTRPGTVLTLDRLTPADGATSQLRELASADNFEEAPPMQPKDRVIVFLRRPGAKPEFDPRPDLVVRTDGWQPANWWGDLRTSAVWLQGGGAYGFAQTMNPGASHLIDFLSTEVKVRRHIRAVLRLRESLDIALSLTNPAERAKKLAVLVRSHEHVASASAFRHLATGGAPAAASLQDLLADKSLLPLHASIIETLVKTGVQNVYLGQVLQRETQYWAMACRSLQPHWWHGAPYPDVETPRSHYVRVHAALIGVRQLRLERDIPAVRNFAAVWNGCPPLDEDEPLTGSEVSREIGLLLDQNTL